MSIHRESVLRITHDIQDVQKSSDLSIAVAFKEENVKRCRALIIGPTDTPYEFGFFEFDFKFPDNYPREAPKVNALTTNGGRTRFNPNIYANGKVCLSILGTWSGEPGEQWSSAQGLESTLWSIQSLLCANPYENEPGREDTSLEEPKAKAYALKIRHETLRISVIKRLEDHFALHDTTSQPEPTRFGEDAQMEAPWEPFIDLCKIRFSWYYESYLESIAKVKRDNEALIKDGRKFTHTDFEDPRNQMSGEFEFSRLEKRLDKIRAKLEEETQDIIKEGRVAMDKENPTALLLQNVFNAVQRKAANSETPFEAEMVDRNPFDWRLIIFGKPMSNLEGGMFKVRCVIPLDFPERQPRVKVETPLFHHRIASDGTLCYTPKSAHDINSHIEAIAHAIEDENPTHDPRTLVNPTAARLLWGSEADKKVYRRKLRRSAQESTDF